ncbi:hypothetical protein [Methanosphaera cuniculi]|uniref:beta strand repeat-containing protein n=1 Tax=Methanosphaera cuniculi TaxID=1077256 RepID=UPI0026F0F5EE|nr:hypothetical protein [Methanosphaera cuniculi]
MKYRNSKFLLIELLILITLISFSTINATDNTTDTITTHENTQHTIDTQKNTDLIKTQENQQTITNSKNENNNINKQSKEKIKTNTTTLNKNNTTKITKKDTATVNSYTELYNKIEEIKTTSTNHEETITLNPGNYTIINTINWGNTTQTTKVLTIIGNGQIIDGENQKYFMQISRDFTIKLENITIQRCNKSDGGAIYNNGILNITNSHFNENSAGNGGVIYNNISAVSHVTIINSTFTKNTASYEGGSIYSKALLNITNTNFTQNSANLDGGAIYNYGNMNLTNSNFNENNATSEGGAIYNFYAKVNITNTNFNKNYAKSGGAIYQDLADMNLTNTSFIQNSAQNAGAIRNYDNSQINITNSTFSGNNATKNGGVMAFERNSIVNITNSTFYNNRAQNGSVIIQQTYHGIILLQNSILNIRNSNFTQNIAEEYGGVIQNNINCSVDIKDSNFNKNNANIGGVINNFDDVTITNSNFTENIATVNGGAINNLRNLLISNTQFSNNKANNNNTIYSTKNFTLKNSNITNNMGDIQFKSTNTFISPIVNEELSDDENVTFNIENKTYIAQKNSTNYVTTTQTITTAGKQDVIIQYPSLNENNIIKLTYNVLKADIQNTTLPDNTISVFTNAQIETIVNDTDKSPLIGEVPVIINVAEKTINTTIKDGLLNVTLPTNTLSPGEYIVTITIPESTNYNNATIIQKLNITKRSIENITLDDVNIISMTNETLYLIINDTNGNQIVGKTPICIKINGVTQIKTIITDGIINVTLPTDTFRNPTYQMLIILGENTNYNMGTITQTINIQKRNSTIKITTNTPKTLENLIVNVTITENDNTPVNGGFVIFKISGVTLKDANGNTIQVNVVNGKAQLNYTLTTQIGARNSNITVVYLNSFYNKETTIQNLTIIRNTIPDKTLTDIKVIQGTNTTLTITVNDTNGKQIQGKTPICIKINGVTQIKTIITDGIINVTLPTDTFRNPTYQMMIILGKNSLYNKATYNGTLKVINPLNNTIIKE